ncbi:hypothetical protein ACNOYE_16405 [Nannocystaceae bacterium ST9]
MPVSRRALLALAIRLGYSIEPGGNHQKVVGIVGGRTVKWPIPSDRELDDWYLKSFAKAFGHDVQWLRDNL